MPTNHIENKYSQNAAILAVTIFLSVAFFIWQGHTGFNFSDEGYLWYGAQRVMLGEVPIRDFLSYDPGRYYWSATLMSLYGSNGIIALRVAAAIFQVIGLYIGLSLISLHYKKISIPYLLLSGVIVTLWTFPYYKSFDFSLCIMTVGTLTFLVTNTTSKRYFLTGLFVGLAFFFGRNHGLYSALGCLGVMFWISSKQTSSTTFKNGFIAWVAGIIVGFLPIITMLLFVEGFATRFLDSITFYFEYKKTNLALPIPWPWEINVESLHWLEVVRNLAIGILFIALSIIPLLIIISIMFKKSVNQYMLPVFVAAIFATLPYAHYAYSRADESHLALSLMPLIITALTMIAAQKGAMKWGFVVGLLIISAYLTLPFHPGWQAYREGDFIDIDISGDKVKVHPEFKKVVDFFNEMNDRYGKEGADFIVVPFWPGAYALMEQKSPIYETYTIVPRSQSFEQAEIERIKSANISFIHIWDVPLDGRDDLRYSNTHPLTYNYIKNNFAAVANPINPNSQIYIPHQ